MKFLTFIISLYLLSNVCANAILKKYGTEIITDNIFIFESKDFKDDEEMHFKIQTHEDNFYYYDYHNPYYSDDIAYYFISGIGSLSGSPVHWIGFKKTTHEDNHLETKYFTIKKRRSDYRPSNGNYIYIQFPDLTFGAYNHATITNTKEDEGKLETWVIVVIVIACVAIIAGLIIFFVCRRIRMRKARQAAMATSVAVINAQNQAAVINAQNQAAAYNYAAQNAAYQAAVVENAQNSAYAAGVEDAQNAMLAQKNYQNQVYQGQGQTYQAQAYQNNNYNSPPPGVVPYAGYSSKTAM